MESFVYDKNDRESEKIIKLSEATFNCKKENLDKIIEFLNNIKNEIENNKVEEGDHWHYRDYNNTWSEKEFDLVVFIDNNSSE